MRSAAGCSGSWCTAVAAWPRDARARRKQFVNDDRAVARAAVPGAEGAQDAQRALAVALEGLDLDHREAFLLKVCEEMEYEELSRLTGVQVSALKMRVKRARDHVRARWPGANDGG
jgi:DNA-directed RNA polymerase specialized sigma24 family protein